MKLSKLKLVGVALFAVAFMMFAGCSNDSNTPIDIDSGTSGSESSTDKTKPVVLLETEVVELPAGAEGQIKQIVEASKIPSNVKKVTITCVDLTGTDWVNILGDDGWKNKMDKPTSDTSSSKTFEITDFTMLNAFKLNGIYLGAQGGSKVSVRVVCTVPDDGSSNGGSTGNTGGGSGNTGTGDTTGGSGTGGTTSSEVVAPSNLKFTNQVLTWEETGSAPLIDYKIYFGDTADFTPSSSNLLKTVGVKEYTAPKDKVNKWFKVSAVKRNSYGAEEQFSTAVQFTNYKQLATPTNVRWETNKLVWDAVEGAKDYNFYYASQENFSITEGASGVTKKNTSGLTSAILGGNDWKNYYYKVTALDGAGNESEPSAAFKPSN